MQFRFYSSLWSSSVPSKTPEKTKKKNRAMNRSFPYDGVPYEIHNENTSSAPQTKEKQNQSKNEKIKGRKQQAPFYLEGDDELFPDCSCCKWAQSKTIPRHTSHTPPHQKKKAFSISKLDNVETYKGVKSMQT
jgi:hypothetical protein